MRLVVIAAMAKNRVIGRDNRLPWRLPQDLARFRRRTWGRPIIMGRRTMASLGRPLPGRRHLVLSRDPEYRPPPGVLHCRDWSQALAACGRTEEAFVIGGAEVFRQAMALADRIELTVLDLEVDGDAFFPAIPPAFTLVEETETPWSPPARILIYERRPRTARPQPPLPAPDEPDPPRA